MRAFPPKIFSTNGSVKDPVAVYTVFAEKRLEKISDPDAPFYLTNVKSKSTDKCWFKCSAVGSNKLGSLVKEMSRKAGFENDKFRNHSTRKTIIQTLSENDLPPTQIAPLSGHYDKPEKHRKLHPANRAYFIAFSSFITPREKISVQRTCTVRKRSACRMRKLQLSHLSTKQQMHMSNLLATFQVTVHASLHQLHSMRLQLRRLQVNTDQMEPAVTTVALANSLWLYSRVQSFMEDSSL